ncbi:MAG: hypothetical protein ACRC6T_00425 [Sarcina sp.]
MVKDSKVEILFDDIRGYINNLENTLINKNKEIDIRNKKIKVLENKTSIIKESVSRINSEKVEFSKALFNIRSIYYLLGQALKIKSADQIRILFDLIVKEEAIKLTEKSNKLLIDALCFYSVYSFDNEDTKKIFLINSIEKLNPERFDGFYRKVFNEIISTYDIQNYIDEDFIIKFIRKTTFSKDKDIAKSIIVSMLNSGRVVISESNIQNIMLLGLYLGIESVRKVKYIESLYIKAMDSRIDNLFINFLIGKIKLDFSNLEGNFMNIKVLNKNLAIYIYNVAKENKKNEGIPYEGKLLKSSLLENDELKTVIKQSTKVIEVEKKREVITEIKPKRETLKSVFVNKNIRVCDIDGGELKMIGKNLSYYDPQFKNCLGEVLENILICKTCKKKVINSDVIRKIYKKIPHSYRLKFKNEKDISLNIFKYNIGLPRSERIKLLKEVICPAMGALNVINEMKRIINLHKMDKSKDYSLSIVEWEHDIKTISAYYDDM